MNENSGLLRLNLMNRFNLFYVFVAVRQCEMIINIINNHVSFVVRLIIFCDCGNELDSCEIMAIESKFWRKLTELERLCVEYFVLYYLLE